MRLMRDCPLGLVLLLATAAPAGAADLVLKRVMLSSGGVGYFEYQAQVDGDASLTLDVPLNQVDDVLKSLVVYDEAGRAGEITLPGREPLAQGFIDLPFDQSALRSTADLLNALQGAEIRIGGDKPFTGRLVHAENEAFRGADGNPGETRLRLSVMADDGLRQTTVNDLDTIAFADPALAAKVKTALARVAAYGAAGRRQLTIATHGGGKRTVRIGYVVGMPLWKASYRLSLPADTTAPTARLQGWAVLENFSGQAWSGVELTVLSGNPVTFRQALYESYYVPRPTVPVESGNRVLPPADAGAVAEPASKAADNAAAERFKAQAVRGAASTALAAPAPAPRPAAPPAPPPAQIEAANAAENATQVAFTLPYKVSVGAGQSLVVPLIDRELPAQRVDLYQPGTAQTHPLAAVELVNKAETALPPGVLTLYEQGEHGAQYLGDARLATFPGGAKRLLSYAVDNKVTIRTDTKDDRAIVKATVAEGVMHLTRLHRVRTTDRVTSAAAPPRLLIEKHALGGNWRLVEPPADKIERTPGGAYRIPAALDPKGNGTVTVVEEQPIEESLALADIGDAQLGLFVRGRELDPKLRQALEQVLQRRQAVARQQSELDRLNDERGKLTEDESRLRDNYTALKDDPAMRKTTLDKLKAAETAIDAHAAAVAKASATADAAKAELAAYIGNLKL